MLIGHKKFLQCLYRQVGKAKKNFWASWRTRGGRSRCGPSASWPLSSCAPSSQSAAFWWEYLGLAKSREWSKLYSVTSKKSPNVYKSCPKLISIEKLKILKPFTKFAKECGRFGPTNCCHSLWKVALSPINRPIWSHWSWMTLWYMSEWWKLIIGIATYPYTLILSSHQNVS